MCDESHKLKDPNTRSSKAVMSLVADHKWLVSGTPVNTSLNDLKNQLQFLGLEHVEAMFKKFSSLMEHSSDPGAGRRRYKSNYKMFPFFFLMRAVLLRHAQNQKYRGTDTSKMILQIFVCSRIIQLDCFHVPWKTKTKPFISSCQLSCRCHRKQNVPSTSVSQRETKQNITSWKPLRGLFTQTFAAPIPIPENTISS